MKIYDLTEEKVTNIKELSVNDAQKSAICHDTGPAIVIAGPGSGKTFVLVHRISYLIENLGVSPDTILIITFTKAAAIEMQERAVKLIGSKANRLIFGTFHSVFFQILVHAGLYDSGSIIKMQQKEIILRELLEENGGKLPSGGEELKKIEAKLSSIKIMLALKNDKSEIEDSDRILMESYEAKLKRNNLLDFDDMLIRTYQLLKDNADIRKMWQDKFKYIMIDEFQDIDYLQFETVKLLLGEEKNIFAVGDDDQSIYGFRGAKTEIMLGFEDDFKACEKIILNYNYRCCEDIVKASLEMIGKNKNRFLKHIRAFRAKKGTVKHIEFENQNDEADFIIKKHFGDKIAGSSAVLARTNEGLTYFAERLKSAGIPFEIKCKNKSIYSHFIAEDFAAYLRLAVGSMDRADFYCIMNKPMRYISRASVKSDKIDFDSIIKYYKSLGKGGKQIACEVKRLKEQLTFMKRLSPFAALNFIYKGMGYEKYLEASALESGKRADDLKNIAEELMELSKAQGTIGDWLKIASNRDEMENAEADKKEEVKLFLTTLHASKGLEYDRVYIVDAVEKNIPYSKAVLGEEVDEERRLFYVGMTRARDELYLLSVKKLRQREVMVSRFIKDAGFLEESGD